MSEIKKTMTFGGVALFLALLALVTAPRVSTPDAFVDRGEAFFPDFEDPNKATTLEVIEFDEETAAAAPFKVTFRSNNWTIPSHHDYPADGKDRLAKTAAGVIGITKDDFRTDNVADHELCGVLDPLDDSATSTKGRGKRVTIRGENDAILADFIVGEKIPEREGFRFVRIPDQKRVYAAKMDIDISTKFEDWIEKDLLEIERSTIDQIVLKDYSINERSRRVDQRDTVTLDKDGSTWKADKMRSSQEVDSTKMNDLAGALDELSIVGVRPKPEGLSEGLKQIEEDGLRITQSDLLSLQGKGYYFTRDGSLLSNEGEVQARTTDGVAYTLRFGEIVYGTGDSVTAGNESSDNQESGPGENRYLFITTEFDPTTFKEPKKPANRDFEGKEEGDLTDADRENKRLDEEYKAWEEKIEAGREKSTSLNDRFARWYYVISAESFDKIHLTRKDLVKAKEKS